MNWRTFSSSLLLCLFTLLHLSLLSSHVHSKRSLDDMRDSLKKLSERTANKALSEIAPKDAQWLFSLSYAQQVDLFKTLLLIPPPKSTVPYQLQSPTITYYSQVGQDRSEE